MSSSSVRVLRVLIVALSLVYVLLHFHLHNHQPQQDHQEQPMQTHLENHDAFKRTDNETTTQDEQGVTVAVGAFPLLRKEDRGQLQNNNGNNNVMVNNASIDWDSLYAHGVLASHSCRMSKNNKDKVGNVTFLRAPDFILAGVQKAGTTALFALLSFHPQIVPSSHFEEHFFDMRYGELAKNLRWKQHLAGQALSCAAAQTYVERMNFHPQLARKIQQQQRQPPRFLTFEKTPNYILWPHIPKAVVQTCPWKPKVIMMLRDPVDRLYSHYQMHFVQDEGIASLEELLNGELQLLRRYGLSHAPPVTAPTNNTQTTFSHSEMAMFHIPNITRRHRDEKDSINFRGFGNHGDYHRFLYRGMYFFQLERWLLGHGGSDGAVDDTVDDSNQQERPHDYYYTIGEDLLVINYGHFKRETKTVMQQVYKFVGTDTNLSFQLTDAQLKATYRPGIDYENRQAMEPAPPLAPSTRRYLEHFYRPYNEQLVDLLGEEWRGVWDLHGEAR